MAAKKPSVLKRERERSRTDKAARKREDRKRRQSDGLRAGPRVATRDELDAYGLDRASSGDPFDGRSDE
jgi:ribosome assembly protein YihI (activator of Der GTPase)